jgi:hypothetical protein
MKILTFASTAISLLMVAGCHATTPLQPPVAEAPVASCLTCGSKAPPVPAIAVTRPPMCNDYPVAYRVQLPETEPRVRAVDRVELISNGTLSPTAVACNR